MADDARPGIETRSSKGGVVHLENLSGYDSADLRRLIRAGQTAMKAPSPLEVVVTSTPQRTRGCAVVGGKKMVLAIAPPSRFSKAKLARILKHELLHVRGKEHENMAEDELWSSGEEPAWARSVTVRYRGRGEIVGRRLK